MTEQKNHVKVTPIVGADETFDDLRKYAGPRDWLVKGLLLMEHLTMLTGKGGYGKSMLALCIAVHVATLKDYSTWWPTKETIPGQSKPHSRKVLILTSEDDEKELKRRLVAIATLFGIEAHELWDRIYILTPDVAMNSYDVDIGLFHKVADRRGNVSIMPTDLALGLRKMIEDTDACYVVLDPMRETHDLGENSNDEMIVVMKKLRELARRCKVPIMIVHHDGRGTIDESDAGGGRGASAIRALARIGITLIAVSKERWKEVEGQLITDERFLNNGRLPDVGKREDYYEIYFGKVNYSARGTGHFLRMISVDTGIRDEKNLIEWVGVPVPVEYNALSAESLKPVTWPRAMEFLALVRDGKYSAAKSGTNTLRAAVREAFCSMGRSGPREADAIIEAFEREKFIERRTERNENRTDAVRWILVEGAEDRLNLELKARGDDQAF